MTKLPRTTPCAAVAATTPWVPALVRCTTRRPERSRSSIADGEFPMSKPGMGRPPISPVRKSDGSAAFIDRACAGSPTRTISRAPAATQNAAVVNARNTSTMTAWPVAARAPSRKLATRTFTRATARPGPSQDRRGERTATRLEPREREIGDIESVRTPVEHLLDDELRGRGRVHEAVARETRRDVQPAHAGNRAHDRMIVRRHLVVTGPRAGDPQIRERRVAPRGARAHPRLERGRHLERRERAGLHDRARVRPDRHGDARRCRERRGPAPRREQQTLARDLARVHPHADHTILV